MNSCPYCDVLDESYVRLNAMIETTNERHEHFVSKMREFSLLHETDSSLPLPRLDASLYDDYEPSLPLESSVVDDAHMTNLEVELDPPLISFPFIAQSSSRTPIATNVSNSTLLLLSLWLSARS